MQKSTLIQMLSSLPDNAQLEAEFCFSRPYSSAYQAKISAVTIVVTDDCTSKATLQIKEVEQLDEKEQEEAVA